MDNVFQQKYTFDMDDLVEWGAYQAPSSTRKLQLLAQWGLSRGIIKKQVLKRWQTILYHQLVDFERDGIKYRLDISNNVTDRRILTSSKEYDGRELAALLKASSGGVFVDIGANIGYYSLVAASRGARQVFAFEPNPPTLERLNFNVSANALNERITILPVGVGENGSFELYSSGDLGSASLLPQENYESVRIQVRPLLEVLSEHGVDSIGGLKIDIEGMEDRALIPFFKEAPETFWPKCIVLEHCNEEDWEINIIDFLIKESGYELKFSTRGNTVLSRS